MRAITEPDTDARAARTAAMSSATWLAVTLSAIVLIAMSHILLAWRLDLLGIYRDPRGRSLVTSRHEGKAKYLLNQAYVPANFDALIIGASASTNWRARDLSGYRFYDESLDGGNATEERKLVEQALPKGHFKLAIVCLFPRITQTHGYNDGIDQVSRLEALGSIGALSMEYDLIANRIGHRPSTFYPDGSHDLPVHNPPPANLNLPKMDVSQDKIAQTDYEELVQELMTTGTRVIYVTYPVYGPFYDSNREALQDYLKSISNIMPPAPIIDFNTSEYAAFRNDNSNYIDEFHLSAKGADTLTQFLDARLEQILSSKQN